MLSKNSSRHRLQVLDLELDVHLGCHEEERRIPQKVRFSMDLKFNQPMPVLQSDDLSDALCYASLSEVIKAEGSSQSFNTVEHLAQRCFDSLREKIPSSVALNLSVHKIRPPVDGLKGGVIYKIEEF